MKRILVRVFLGVLFASITLSCGKWNHSRQDLSQQSAPELYFQEEGGQLIPVLFDEKSGNVVSTTERGVYQQIGRPAPVVCSNFYCWRTSRCTQIGCTSCVRSNLGAIWGRCR